MASKDKYITSLEEKMEKYKDQIPEWNEKGKDAFFVI